MSAKKANHHPTASRTFQSITDIDQFEEELAYASMTSEDKEWYEKPSDNQRTFKTAQERDQHVQDLASELQLENQFVDTSTGNTISPNHPKFKQKVQTGEVITLRDFVDQTVVQPYRDGRQDKAELSLEPIIFKAKGKTSPSVPYLKVTVTTALETSTEASHLLHVRVRTKK